MSRPAWSEGPTEGGWCEETVRVAMMASARGGLAVHPELVRIFQEAQSWVITHIDTGLRFPDPISFETKADAMAFADAVLAKFPEGFPPVREGSALEDQKAIGRVVVAVWQTWIATPAGEA